MIGPAYRGLEESGTASWGVAARLFRYVLPNRRLLYAAAAVFLLLAVTTLATLWAVENVVDRGIRTGDEGPFTFWIAILAAVIFGRALLEFLKMWTSSLLGQRIIFDVRARLFRHIHTLPLRYFDRTPVGMLVTRVTSDVEALAEMFSSGVAAICSDLLLLVVITVWLFVKNATLAFVALLALPVVISFSLWFGKRMRVAFREVRLQLSRLNGFQQEAFTGVSTTRLFRRESLMQERFDARNVELRDAHFKTIFNFSLFWPAVQSFSALAQAGIVLLGAHALANGQLTWGEMLGFWLALSYFFGPIHDLSDRFNVLQAALASSERIFSVLDEAPETADAADAVAPKRLRGEVEFRDVEFGYVEGESVLKGVSFRVRPGETVAIVGPTGAGKTSIISLLGRLWDVDGGQVLVDGIDVRRFQRRALRSRMAVVLQDVFLFHATVAENVRMGNTALSDDTLRKACETVHADSFIENLDGGYDAEIRERGSNLSVGQKQLLAFARALATDPDILVLDEATSSIDTATEALIQDALKRLMEGRTAIIIAHRLSTVREADRILVMHHGKLCEQGTHQELLAQGGVYARLYQLSQATASGETL